MIAYAVRGSSSAGDAVRDTGIIFAKKGFETAFRVRDDLEGIQVVALIGVQSWTVEGDKGLRILSSKNAFWSLFEKVETYGCYYLVLPGIADCFDIHHMSFRLVHRNGAKCAGVLIHDTLNDCPNTIDCDSMNAATDEWVSPSMLRIGLRTKTGRQAALLALYATFEELDITLPCEASRHSRLCCVRRRQWGLWTMTQMGSGASVISIA